VAYQVPWGTPERTRRLPPLRAPRPSLAVPGIAGATLLVLLAAHAAWRGLAAPGPVSQAHGASERRCEECHALPGGTPNLRCQRCHDQGGAERLSHPAHEQAGRRLAAAATRTAPSCASCHREHLGRPALLAPRDDGQCARCHFRGLPAHPEFGRGVVAAAEPRRAPGSGFSHRKHVAKLAERGVASADSCLGCHPPSNETRDLQPIDFDRHCASCHASTGSLGATDPVSPEDVLTPRDIGEFQTTGGRIVKTLVRHRDAWVLGSLARLRWQIDPDGAAAERGALEAQMSVLRRRLALAAPLAGLDLAALEARSAVLAAEIARLEARRAASGGAQNALGQVRAAAEAAVGAGAGEAAREARQLQARAHALGGSAIEPQALGPQEHDERRLELLVVLDTLAAVSPDLRLRTEDLRRRVLALRPGDSTEAVVARTLAERRAEQRRVEDELGLRRSGVVPPLANLLARERRALEDALADAAARLRQIGTPPPSLAAAETAHDPASSLAALVVRCAPCHRSEAARLGEPPVTRPVFVRAAFVHGPHLGQAACGSCHAGVEVGESSGPRHLPGIARCRECHAPRRVLSSCQHCHRYHPAGP
jgi:hypothetical protein